MKSIHRVACCVLVALSLHLVFADIGEASSHPIVGRWMNVRHVEGMDISVVFSFSEEGTFEARSTRTDTTSKGRGGLFVVMGTWTMNGRRVTVIPKSVEPRGEATSDPMVLEVIEATDDHSILKAEEDQEMRRFEKEPNQALQTTSVTRSGFGKVPVSDRQRRGV